MRRFEHPWHMAINSHCAMPGSHLAWMYRAKDIAEESERLPKLFRAERERELPDQHRQCCASAPEAIPDNHLTCALGVECRACPHLQGLEAAPRFAAQLNAKFGHDAHAMSPDDLDRIKAWTCISHILAVSWSGADNPPSRGADLSEGFIQTVGDRMFWDRVHGSLASGR